MTSDSIELNYQYRRYREDTDAYFSRSLRSLYLPAYDDPDDLDSEDDLMATLADYPKAAGRLRRFIMTSAKNMGVPASERADIAGDAILEIVGDVGRQQFEMLLESIDSEHSIVAALRGSTRGLQARNAIKRVLARFRFPQKTFTDIGLNNEVADEP